MAVRWRWGDLVITYHGGESTVRAVPEECGRASGGGRKLGVAGSQYGAKSPPGRVKSGVTEVIRWM